MGNSVKTVVSRKEAYEYVDDGILIRQGHKYDIPSAGVAYMLIRCGSWYPHVLLNAIADGDLEIEFLAAPTISDTGDPEPSGNFNFNSGKTSLTTWFTTPTITFEGFHAATTWILGGSGVGAIAGSRSTTTMSDFDVILMPNVDFLIKFSNMAGRDMQLMFEAVYVERQYDHSNDCRSVHLYPSEGLYPMVLLLPRADFE